MIYNFVYTVIFFGITVLSEKIYYYMRPEHAANIPLAKYAGLFGILFIFSFIHKQTWRFVAMSLMITLGFIQMVHLEFFGLRIHATEVYLFFTQFGEVAGTIKEDFFIFFLPSIILLMAMAILVLTHKKFPKLKTYKWVLPLFILYMIYNPIRTFATGNQWGRQPSYEEFNGMNVYTSISYMLGRILPHKLGEKNQTHASSTNGDFTFEKTRDFNIVLVLGESLSYYNMSLFGYERETTPFLSSLKSDPNFYFTKGISAGVSTDVALAFFMNNTFGESGSSDIVSGKGCLFNLAKNAGHKTYFLSIQSQSQLRYITNSVCPKSINVYKSLENIDPTFKDENAASDDLLLNEFGMIDLTQKSFVVLHQRGSHSPYNLRYDKNIARYNENNRKDHYDNSVLQFDAFMQKLLTKIKEDNKPTLMVYISDHGEFTGQNNIWGHGMLKQVAMEIPVLIYAHNVDELGINQLPHIVTHLNISRFLAFAMGYNHQNPWQEIPNPYIVFGNDMDGFSGYKTININGKEVVVK